MPRKPRFNLTGVAQHVIQRGNNRNPCFFRETDYRRYLEDLSEVSEKYRCRIHAYVLMTNHAHLLVTPDAEYAISRMMQALGSRYVHYVNRTQGRTGTLWEGRYKSSLVDSERYLLACMRYIELNPVRANMVERPVDYRWSSYHANANGAKDALISAHPVYEALARKRAVRQQAYKGLFRDGLGGELTDEIRQSLHHELVLGRSKFKDEIEQVSQRQTRPGKVGRRPSIRDDNAD